MGTPAPVVYPIQLGLAYLFFVGYVVRSLFLLVRLPGAVGVIVSGFAFSYFMQPDILDSRDDLQALAFFFVLLIAGLEISLQDLRLKIIVVAILPATFELLAITCFSVALMGYTWIEGGVLGCALFCVGDGLVIPKMQEFRHRDEFRHHRLPRLVFMCAPLEASFALTVFGVLGGLAEPADQPTSELPELVVANFFRIFATVAVGAFLGLSLGIFLKKRHQVNNMLYNLTGRWIFTELDVESCLLMVSTALAAFSLGASEAGQPLIPMSLISLFGGCGGSLFQSELLVIVTGSCFALVDNPEVVDSVQSSVSSIWVFGQLILFSMLGSRTDTAVFAVCPSVLPVMVTGLCARFLGVCLAVRIAQSMRPSCSCDECQESRRATFWPETLFIFLSSLPRASIQGALGSIPATLKFFQRDGDRRHVQVFIADAARFYIICMSICGSILLDCVGPAMLTWAEQASQECQRIQRCKSSAEIWCAQEEKLASVDAAETFLAAQTLEIARALSLDSYLVGGLDGKAPFLEQVSSDIQRQTFGICAGGQPTHCSLTPRTQSGPASFRLAEASPRQPFPEVVCNEIGTLHTPSVDDFNSPGFHDPCSPETMNSSLLVEMTPDHERETRTGGCHATASNPLLQGKWLRKARVPRERQASRHMSNFEGGAPRAQTSRSRPSSPILQYGEYEALRQADLTACQNAS